MKDCSIACVILNYNDAETTLALINQIKAYEVLKYIVVVDNHSSDYSLELLLPYVNEKIRIIEQNENRGYGTGNNAGVKYAFNELDCRYALIANPDVMFSKQCVEELADIFTQDSNVAVTAPVQYHPNGKIENEYAWKIPSIKQWIWSPEHLLHKYCWPSYSLKELNDSIKNKERTMDVECVPGAMLMVDAEKFLQCKGYDEDNFLYCEETILGIKLKEKGYTTKLAINQNYVHLESQTVSKNVAGRSKRKALMMDSRCRFIENWLKATPKQCKLCRLVADLAIFETKVSEITGIR